MKVSNKKITVLIVDDEPFARKRIANLLRKKEDFEIVGESSNGMEAVEAIQNQKPDLVFLDIQMPDMDGFEVLENLEMDKLPYIIFVTAYDKYALKAFEIHAIDYLLKPFKNSRFDETLEHISNQIKEKEIGNLSGKLTDLLISYQNPVDDENTNESSKEKPKYQNRFIIKSIGKISFVKVDDVDWIGAEGPYVSLNTKNKTHLMRGSLKDLETKLDPEKFLRIHRSTMVNISRIKELHPYSHGDYFVILENGKKLKLSRGYRKQAEKLIESGI